jgi:hypothetical protein
MDTPEQDQPADPPKLSPWERRERAAGDALRTLIRDLLEYEFGAQAGRHDPFAVGLNVRLDPGQAWALRFHPPLREQLLEQTSELFAARDVYQPGRVYCFRCDSAACEHAAPDSSLQIFGGYSSTGTPLWTDFSQLLVQLRDARVDALFQTPARFLTVVQSGHDVKGEQLSSFGRASKSYAILGQVAAGYFNLSGSAGHRQAATFQAVETRSRQGEAEVHLNTLLCIPGGATPEEIFADEGLDWIRRARDQAVAELRRLAVKVTVARAGKDNPALRREMGRVPEILRRLAASLERGHGQSRRRTRHVEQRRREQRPVHMAVPDTLNANPGSLLLDGKTQAVISCGEHGRFHVFTQDGRHITSFTGKAGSLEFRLRTRRWETLDADEAAAFLSGFRQAIGRKAGAA